MKKGGAIFLFAAALLGILFFVALFLSIRPDPDDMLISLDIRGQSLFYALKTRYLHSSFRITLLFTEQLIYGWQDTALYPLTTFMFCALLFVFLVYVLYKLCVELFLPENLSLYQRALWIAFSVTQAMAIYFLCSNRIEVFGWIGAMGGHLVPVVFALWTLWLVVKRVQKRSDIFLLALGALIIAGGAEHAAAWVFITGSASFFAFKKQLDTVRKRRLLVFLFSLLVFCLCISTNPGVWNRSDEVNTLLEQNKNYDPGVFWLMFFQPYKLIGLLLIVSGFLSLKSSFPQIRILRINFSYLLIFGIITVAICALSGYAAYRTFALGRIWFPFDVFIYLIIAAVTVHLLGKKTLALHWVAGLAAVFFIGWHCVRHIPALWNFKQGYDAVVNQVKETRPGDTAIITDFPPPDLVNLVELSADPANEMNQLFTRFYGSEAKLSVVKQPN